MTIFEFSIKFYAFQKQISNLNSNLIRHWGMKLNISMTFFFRSLELDEKYFDFKLTGKKYFPPIITTIIFSKKKA